jgi:acetyl-CoA C-acetyltransferase
MNGRTNPIIIGTAQYTQPKETPQPLDPLNLMVKTCRMALNDTGTEGNIKQYLDTIYMVNINSWSYEDAPGELSRIIGINPAQKVYLPDGGDSPQMLVNRAARAIASGKSKAILITGAEAAYSVRSKKNLISEIWPKSKEPKYMEGKLWHGTSEFENKYGMIFPSCSYAMFETAIRAAEGRSLAEHRKFMGKLFECFSKIASKNPNAWLQKSLTSEEISNPSPKNRLINYPYTKHMCSNMFVDQSASLIMTSEKIAKTLNIDQKSWIYLMGVADFKNIHNVTQRPQLNDSPAAREGSRIALEQAGLKSGDIEKFDIYSCFPSAVEIIKKEIGIDENDPRDLTITGGLPYFGGPWSNYSMHAIITAVNLIRKIPSLKIMVVSNGGYNTKQSFGIYGTKPPFKSWTEFDDAKIQRSILEKALPEPVIEANGNLTIEAYTFLHERDGSPKRGIVIGHLENGYRTCAVIDAEPEVLLKLEGLELVGRSFPVYYNSSIDRNLIKLTQNEFR